MNKKLKFLPLLVLLSGMVIGCGPTVTDSTTDSKPNETVPSETVTESETTDSQLAPWVDYAKDGNVKLNHDYVGKDFYKDGIGQVKLRTCIDGDTAHFEPLVKATSGENIKARFFGIDTPESTGKVQPWGKPASDYTKSQLKKAEKNGTIVVSSPFEDYHRPAPDSTGERYVSLVWINTEKKNAPIEELYLLNLMIVQNGLSWVKNVLSMPQYSDTFYDAEAQARAYKLNMFGDEPDPSFPTGEYEVISLLDLKRDIINTLEDSSYESLYNNKRVAVTGAVAGYVNRILYLQDYFNEEVSGTPGGECAGINIFTGMSPVPSKYTTKNTYIQLFGLVQVTENFGFQLTDTEGRFPTVSFDEHDTKIILKASENVDEHQLKTFEYDKAADLAKTVHGDTRNYESLNCAVKVNEPLKVTRVFIKSNDEITLYFNNIGFDAYITFGYVGDETKPEWIWSTTEDFVGQSFLVSGIFTFHKTMSGKILFQINPNNSGDLVWVR